MPLLCALEQTRRARPFLGTLVSIAADGLESADAVAAIEAAFAEIAAIHRLMSFHERDSDVARLNRTASQSAVAVDPHTRAVLRAALTVSRASHGVFDVTIAPRLVAAAALPAPVGAPAPDPAASWRDIEIDGSHVRFHRPLWIDLGGIAKGYAVDRALARLRSAGAPQAYVNAGGDLAVYGDRREPVLLRAPAASDQAPMIQLSNAALASSAYTPGAHIGAAPDARCAFVSVVADQCMLADALTKVVLAQGADSAAALTAFNAGAYLYDGVWRSIGSLA